MKLKLTTDIFSGRPNPFVILDNTEAKKFLNSLQVNSKFKKIGSADADEPTNLGYRGIIVEQLSGGAKDMPESFRVIPDALYADGKRAALEDTETEKIIFDNLYKFEGIGDESDFAQYLRKEIARFRREYRQMPKHPFWVEPVLPKINICQCAPPHELAWWNDGGVKQRSNNCYNYASNYRSDTFAQPGRAAGAMYTSLAGCAVPAGQRSAKSGAVADSLIDTPTADNKCPKPGHLVALVIAPGRDFHWYRKGNDGKWSHKPGSTQATLIDNSGNPITDPRTANRGPYTQFCTFMQVIHGHIKIS